MIVVADTSPINYLIQIGCIEILPSLYGRVFIPHEVHDELLANVMFPKVRDWALEPPGWLEIRSSLPTGRPELDMLDAGELAAINLALELHAEQLLVDESKARRIAIDLIGLEVTGTLGVLRDAHFAKYIDAYEAFERLRQQTNFYLNPKVSNAFLESLPERL